MRMGYFIAGGILGAAAVMIASQNKRMMALADFGQMGNVMNKMMSAAKNRMNDMGMGRLNTSSDNANNTGDKAQLMDMIEQDKQAQSQVNEIMAESNNGNRA